MNAFIIATFNTRVPVDNPPFDWASRAPRCLEIIKRNKFDIFGMQEPRKQQVDDIAAGTAFRSVGGGRDDFKDAGEFSNIIYNPERFELRKSGTFGLSEHPEIPGFISWNSCCPRIASWGVFRDRRPGGREFFYSNTHLDHVSEEARVNGIRLVLERAAKDAAGLPVIITGDFNSFPDDAAYKLAVSHLRDVCKVSEKPYRGPANTFHNWGKGTQNAPIDYIFVSKEFRVLASWADDTKPFGNFASDHYPVIAEIALP